MEAQTHHFWNPKPPPVKYIFGGHISRTIFTPANPFKLKPADNILGSLERQAQLLGGQPRWGFPVLRGSYSDDEAWERAENAITAAISEPARREGHPELIDLHMATVLADPQIDSATGATKAQSILPTSGHDTEPDDDAYGIDTAEYPIEGYTDYDVGWAYMYLADYWDTYAKLCRDSGSWEDFYSRPPWPIGVLVESEPFGPERWK
ncbi:hypothetical protein GQ53DRAFT_803671 [Thozetella sp. PMI_491]|nr:hypothetical protein GQ53DRAFT_803671 [Thozetella sp. PMI_491]